MNPLRSMMSAQRSRFQAAAVAGILSVALPALAGATDADPAQKTSDTKIAQATPAKAGGSTKSKSPQKSKLGGAELYSIHCNRCHPERYPMEFTPAQWKTLMLHMRVRANLPAVQAKALLKYLQSEAGS